VTQIHEAVVVLHDEHPEGSTTFFPLFPNARHPVKLAGFYWYVELKRTAKIRAIEIFIF